MMAGRRFDLTSPDAEQEAGWLFNAVRRLKPSSGLQFLDLTLSGDQLALTQHCFIEHRIDGLDGVAGPRHVLLTLQRDSREPGVAWHPVTYAPLGPEQSLWLNGYDGLEPFLDTWVPVPYLRYRRRDETGRPTFDPGPNNWARVFVASPPGGLRGAERLPVVLAVDTRVEPTDSLEPAGSELAPNAQDVLFGSTFVFWDDPEDLAQFVSEPWIDAWLRDCLEAYRARSPAAAAAQSAPLINRQLEHVARYLCFLKVLRQSAAFPQLRFVNVFDAAEPEPATGVDLVLDIRCNETSALLVERKGEAATAELGSAQMLRVRDLSQPNVVHEGPHPTVVEFDLQPFGNTAASRASGRTDAFSWPSLARIGTEAVRLSQRPNAAQGVTGLTGLKACLTQTAAGRQVWRFSSGNASASERGQMVFGEALSQVAEDGSVVGANPQGVAPAIRPRFSQSSLLSFFAAELILHALAQIHAPSADAGDKGLVQPRELQRVLVTADLSMPDDERRLLIERIEGGVDIVWRAFGWDGSQDTAARPKPQVSFGLGADLGVQLVYMFEEVRHRFAGDFASFFEIAGASVGDAVQRQTLRIASIELGGAVSSLTIVDYEMIDAEAAQPALMFAERRPFGRDAAVKALAKALIVPAIEARLAACGLTDPAEPFRAGVVAPYDSSTAPLEGRFSGRLDHLVLKPAGLCLLRLLEQLPPEPAAGSFEVSVGDLVREGGGRLDPFAAEFDAAAAEAGAKGFKLGEIKLRVGRAGIARVVQGALQPGLSRVADIAKSYECDLLLVGGEFGRSPEVADCLLTLLPMPPHRILPLAERDWSLLRLPSGGSAVRSDPQAMIGVVAAYMASRDGAPEFDRIAGDLGQKRISAVRREAPEPDTGTEPFPIDVSQGGADEEPEEEETPSGKLAASGTNG